MEILTGQQMKQADEFTIMQQPVSSIDLMERASHKCFEWINSQVSKSAVFHIVCGQGNNGGDGLALARMLLIEGYKLKVNVLQIRDKFSSDCQVNLERLKTIDSEAVEILTKDSHLSELLPDSIVIDAIFGTGFSGIPDAFTSKIIRHINSSGHRIISIDLPSGIHSDQCSFLTGFEIIKATNTLTFQYLKPALMVVENADYFGRVEVLDIGLMKEALNGMEIKWHQADSTIIQNLYKSRKEFSHKGNFGHALLIAGGAGKIGAGVLSATGWLRSGGGLLSLLVPAEGVAVMQSSVPEAMTTGYSEPFVRLPDISAFNVIGVGPGLGTHASAKAIIDQLLNTAKSALVLDADALNIIASERTWLRRIPGNSILTPHPGEFRRLVGDWKDDFHKLKLQQELAIEYQIYVILKGKNTSVATPDGHLWFNPTGNSGMAKGGSGDILTGLLTGLVSSGYTSFESCILGTWLHGLAGDFAAEKLTMEAMNARDICDHLPLAWKTISNINSFQKNL